MTRPGRGRYQSAGAIYDCCETRGVHRSLPLAETTLSDHVGRTGAQTRSPAVDRHR